LFETAIGRPNPDCLARFCLMKSQFLTDYAFSPSKGQFGLDDPFDSVVLRSFGFFAISVWIVFSDRNFTHRDRKVRKGQFGLADPFDSVVLRFFAFFATSVWNRRFASRLLGDGLGRYRSLMKDY
jgi:hypothetical protein